MFEFSVKRILLLDSLYNKESSVGGIFKMAKLIGLKIKFQASASPDVVTNNLYYAQSPGVVDYDSTHVDVGNVKDEEGFVNVNLGEHLSGLDGIYNIGIAAVDDVGNEADMSKANDLPLDFQAPEPVGTIIVL